MRLHRPIIAMIISIIFILQKSLALCNYYKLTGDINVYVEFVESLVFFIIQKIKCVIFRYYSSE